MRPPRRSPVDRAYAAAGILQWSSNTLISLSAKRSSGTSFDSLTVETGAMGEVRLDSIRVISDVHIE
jgi:hypothetical protein